MKRELPECISRKEYCLLIKSIPKEDIISKISFELAYKCGLKISEVKKFSSKQIRKNLIILPKSKHCGGELAKRFVPLPKGWKKEYLFELPPKVSIRTLQRRFEKYRDIAGLSPRYSFHSLRHGFGLTLIKNKIPIAKINFLMGYTGTTHRYISALQYLLVYQEETKK